VGSGAPADGDQGEGCPQREAGRLIEEGFAPSSDAKWPHDSAADA
jgi:hypothetical protein